MADEYWWTFDGDAGQVGTTAQIGLPAGERILTVRDGMVVSARPAFDSHYAPADLIVRSIETGTVIRQIATNVGFPYAELVDRQLFWAGMEPTSSTTAGRFIDGGVWVASIDDNLTPTIIVRPGRNLAPMGRAQRAPLVLSPTGLTLASSVSGSVSAFTDVIDTGSMTVTKRLDAAVLALTDDAYVARDGAPVEPPDGLAIRGFDLATAAQLWAFPSQAADVARFALVDIVAVGSAFDLQHTRTTRGGGQHRIASLDARTGAARTLLVQRLRDADALRYAAFSISSAEHIALVPELGSIGHLVQNGDGVVALLDTATGDVTDNAFVIDPPWLCYPVFCVRD